MSPHVLVSSTPTQQSKPTPGLPCWMPTGEVVPGPNWRAISPTPPDGSIEPVQEVSFRWSAETSYTSRQSWLVSVRQHCPGRRSSTVRRGGSDDGRVRSRRNSRRRVRSDRGRGGSPTRGYWPALVGER